ncbi:MAG: DUF6456 domain-containing protein [Hyphomicrobiales bacterium]|nr:DUF6456 domain-containing protein [Hyphomicrobiales bacterium]
MGAREKPGGIERKKLRILKFLVAGPARIGPASSEKSVLLEGGERGTIAAGHAELAALASAGLLVRASGAIGISVAGEAALRRAAAEGDPYREQHGEIAPQRFDTANGWIVANVNMAESPLAQLARRKAKDGSPFLRAAEWRAGERLRTDYTRARIMPRLGANWQAAIASGRRDGGAGGIAELTDAALAARQRVEHALDAVGPELAGVLIDVCCFLKGLETVEMERGWPVRSAKIMLKSALGALSRHYERPKEERPHRGVLHWGTEDYRPHLNTVAAG